MKPLTVVATFVARPGKEEELAPMLEAMLVPTRSEQGCINYDLHRSLDAPGTFVFTESWATKALWEAHMASPHAVELGKRKEELTERWEDFVGEIV